MPLHVGERTYPRLRNLIGDVKNKHPDVKDPGAYAATITRAVEPGFDKKRKG